MFWTRAAGCCGLCCACGAWPNIEEPCCPKALWPGVEPNADVEPNAGGPPNTEEDVAELEGGWPKTEAPGAAGAALCPPKSDWVCCWGWACAENMPPAPAGRPPKTDEPVVAAAMALPPPKMEDPGAEVPAELPPPNTDVPKAEVPEAFPPNIPEDADGDVAAAAAWPPPNIEPLL